MSRPDPLSEWTSTVSTNLPHLTKPQATVLAMWSYGIAFTRCCGRLTVASFLALLLERKVASVEQRLYDWCLDRSDKAGPLRQDLDVSACFAPLLAWVLRLWSGQQLALAIDASSLGQRFVVLAVSVVYRGNAIPVAWTILPAGHKHAWRREWLRMLRMLGVAMPPEMTVLVLADRGLYASWLFRRIVRLGWHPMLRINQRCTFRPAAHARFLALPTFCGREGQRWRGRGTAFGSKGCELDCTLVAWWGEGHKEPWFILTDLDPEVCDAVWYGLRGWCEQGFKSLKRGGWQWQQTQMQESGRAARIWLAMAVASLWMISVGSEGEDDMMGEEEGGWGAVLGRRKAQQRRGVRVFRLGWLMVLVRAIRGQQVPMPRQMIPEPWPDVAVPLLMMPVHKRLSYAVM